MRKNLNKVHIEGYVYDISKLEKKVTGEKSKNPGTPYFRGKMQVAVDEEGMNVIPVQFQYVAPTYPKGKENPNFNILDNIVKNNKSWLSVGKEGAAKVKVDCNLSLLDFPDSNGEMVAAPIIAGSFISLTENLTKDVDDRHTFQADMVITRVNHVDADPEKNINQDYTRVGGAVFNYKNALLPMEFKVLTPGGMKFFEDLDVSNTKPSYRKVWGKINNSLIKQEKIEESAFGENEVQVIERNEREWAITGTAKVPYDYGDEEVLTAEDLTKAQQDREVYLAEQKKNHDEYVAQKDSLSGTASVAPTAPVQAGGFHF